MVSIDIARASNAKLKSLGPGLVAVFVGGTSGIGESTAREFVRNTVAPHVYLVGRNEIEASRIQVELKALNAEAQVSFIQGDLTLLKNVDRVCTDIKAKEHSLNLLFMSTGFLSLAGRTETEEGLDKKFNLNYYSRLRFTQNLLPLLTTASKNSSLSRNVSVLGAGTEGKLDLADLSLKNNYGVSACAKHATAMNSIAAEVLAKQYPGTSFVHMYPGIIQTGIMREIGMPKILEKLMFVVLKPFTVDIKEAGERHLYSATSEAFLSKDDGGAGSYLLNWNNDMAKNEKVMRPYREESIAEKIWQHTLDVFDTVATKGQKWVGP